MFGHHNLYRDGVPARSVIISVRAGVEIKHGHSTHDQFLDGGQLPHEAPGQRGFYDVVADVEFGDGTTGQHTERLWRHQVGACEVGDVLPARYDKQHRDKVVFDLPELEASRYSPKERADGQTRAPGSMGARIVSRGDVRNLLGELAADPQAFATHMRQLAQENGSSMIVVSSTSTGTGTGTGIGTGLGPQVEAETGFPVVDFGEQNDEEF